MRPRSARRANQRARGVSRSESYGGLDADPRAGDPPQRLPERLHRPRARHPHHADLLVGQQPPRRAQPRREQRRLDPRQRLPPRQRAPAHRARDRHDERPVQCEPQRPRPLAQPRTLREHPREQRLDERRALPLAHEQPLGGRGTVRLGRRVRVHPRELPQRGRQRHEIVRRDLLAVRRLPYEPVPQRLEADTEGARHVRDRDALRRALAPRRRRGRDVRRGLAREEAEDLPGVAERRGVQSRARHRVVGAVRLRLGPDALVELVGQLLLAREERARERDRAGRRAEGRDGGHAGHGSPGERGAPAAVALFTATT
ncbi:hypothetical protein [Streptomyces sp. SA3_actF]|uniref:hypothetical protein n=1 Tax=Streptomyces sp. SA3_actF TaxID=682181 RepID=UPI002D21B411|nr:hypothetical protein [Streptomyces sp. SA3_actF]